NNVRASSGSRLASSSSEPLISANSTVTCLRSASRECFDVRIFSTRYLGVYASGDKNFGAGPVNLPASKRFPHSLQNLCERALPVPHWRQTSSSLAPHSGQNSVSGGA